MQIFQVIEESKLQRKGHNIRKVKTKICRTDNNDLEIPRIEKRCW